MPKCVQFKAGLYIFPILLLFPAAICVQAQENTAIFAGGCFWCMEAPFEKLKGVDRVVSGYTGGQGKNPTYEDYHHKGHLEAIQVTYDSTKVTYQELLGVFWRQINPTDARGQFADRGSYYRSAIFFNNNDQKVLAERSKNQLTESKIFAAPIATDIIKSSDFYPAEEYHQDYYKNHPLRYKFYRMNSGRDQFLRKIWNKKNNLRFKIK